MQDTALLVWYRTENSAELECGHVAAWQVDTPMDDQGTATGPAVTTLAGLADPIVAVQIVEEARRDQALLWIVPGFDGVPALDNLLAIWGDDVVLSGVSHNGSNPTLPPPVETPNSTDTPGDLPGATVGTGAQDK